MAAPLTDKDRNTTKTIHQSRRGQAALISSGHLHCLPPLCATMCLHRPMLKTKANIKTESKILKGPKCGKKISKTATAVYGSFMKRNLIPYLHTGLSLLTITEDLQANQYIYRDPEFPDFSNTQKTLSGLATHATVYPSQRRVFDSLRLGILFWKESKINPCNH